jgi:Mor family transcriptional regulator
MATGQRGTFEARLVELLGATRAHDLIDRHRCETLSIPRELNENHPLTQAVGMEVAAVLVAEWPGRRLSIPTGYARRMAVRNQQIRAARAAGVSVRQLVRDYRLSSRTIYSITSPRNSAARR